MVSFTNGELFAHLTTLDRYMDVSGVLGYAVARNSRKLSLIHI